jgi:hypothetical protein
MAERYCSKCNLVICNDCIIDNHSDHLKDAKTRIKKLLTEQPEILNELKKRTDELASLARSRDIKAQAENQEKIINGIFDKRINRLENLRTKIQMLTNEENNLRKLALESLKTSINIELISKIHSKVEEINNRK